MPEIFDAGLILSFDEIRILLYSLKVNTVEGIYMPEKVFLEEDIIKALHHMSRRGLIKAAGKEFVIRDDLLEMLTIMTHPDTIKLCGQEVLAHSQYFCYIASEKAVISERYWKRKESLKLQLFTIEAFETWKEQLPDDNRN